MSAGTGRSVAEVGRQLATARGQVARAVEALDHLEAGARLTNAAPLIEQLNRLRDLAESFAVVAMQLETFCRDRLEEARALLASAQLELTTQDPPEGPHDS